MECLCTADWPEGAKPVTKKITYDDLYRAVDVRYEYASGDDTWKSPFAAEVDTDANNEDPRRAQPSPHVEFEKRILRQTFEYDWLGNNEVTTDDAGGFYDRSLGEIENGAPAGAAAGSDTKPYQLKGASLSAGRSPGSLEARYDDAGYMTGMVVNRGGPCLVPGVGLSSPEACNQRFVYEWDEVGRLSRARRWDANTSDVDAPAPSAIPAADLRYAYDASDQRTLKEAVDQDENKSFTVYVFASLELRRAQWSDDPAKGGGENGAFDYEASHWTVVPYLLANGVRLARIAYEPDAPKILESDTSQSEAGYVSQHEAAGGSLHVLFELGDHLGSTSVVLDKATGELVERATFQAYGGSESDYRPERWNAFREDYRFTGKEEDVEVGLQYFGKRYLNPLLGRWISADPLAVHVPGEADPNLYAYVSGQVLQNVDPLGLADFNMVEEHGGEETANDPNWVEVKPDGSPANPPEQEEEQSWGDALKEAGRTVRDIWEHRDEYDEEYRNRPLSEEEQEKVDEVRDAVDEPIRQLSEDLADIMKEVACALFSCPDPKKPETDDPKKDGQYHAKKHKDGGGSGRAKPQPASKPKPKPKKEDSSKNERHGDDGRALEKIKPRLAELEKQLEGASGREAKKIRQKMKNLVKDAQKKKKGESHHNVSN